MRPPAARSFAPAALNNHYGTVETPQEPFQPLALPHVHYYEVDTPAETWTFGQSSARACSSCLRSGAALALVLTGCAAAFYTGACCGQTPFQQAPPHPCGRAAL